MDDETTGPATVTLTAADWARLGECLETVARYAETNAEQVAGLLQRHPGDAQRWGDRTAWQRVRGHYLALAHDARRLHTAVGRRAEATSADA
jgi:hypothetical protein